MESRTAPVSIGANEFLIAGVPFDWRTIRSILPVVGVTKTSPPLQQVSEALTLNGIRVLSFS